jgi:F-type H+-transporting ATPase subunit b
LDALGLNLGYLFVQIFNFLIVFIVLRAWVFKPIMGLLEKRRLAIAQGLEDARVAAEARANAEREAKDVVAKAQTDAALRIRESTERAETAGRDVLLKAEQDATKIRSDASVEAADERERLLSDVRGQVAVLAIAATQKLVGAELSDTQRQHALIQQFFSGLESGKIAALESGSLHGASAEITSAVPLTDAEKETIRDDILAKTGSQTVTFRVDPGIMGGLVIKVGDKIVDGSVAGQLETLRQSLR